MRFPGQVLRSGLPEEGVRHPRPRISGRGRGAQTGDQGVRSLGCGRGCDRAKRGLVSPLHDRLFRSPPGISAAPASHNIINRGDVVMFEVNVTYGGITPQMVYSLSLGRPSPDLERMFKLCEELYDFSLEEAKQKQDFHRDRAGPLFLQHAAGYEPMTPQIHRYNLSGAMPMDSRPQPGDFFTVHPNMCDKDFTLAAKVGDQVRITQDCRVERLQATPARLNYQRSSSLKTAPAMGEPLWPGALVPRKSRLPVLTPRCATRLKDLFGHSPGSSRGRPGA